MVVVVVASGSTVVGSGVIVVEEVVLLVEVVLEMGDYCIFGGKQLDPYFHIISNEKNSYGKWKNWFPMNFSSFMAILKL